MTETEPKRGRPSNYTAELAADICLRMSEGESLRQICTDETMPGRSTIFEWLQSHKEFADQYAKARDNLLEHWAEEIVEIADDGTNDWIKRQGSTTLNSEHINRSRLRVDTRKWLMSKLGAKKYGDKITQEHTGKDGAPLTVTWLPPLS